MIPEQSFQAIAADAEERLLAETAAGRTAIEPFIQLIEGFESRIRRMEVMVLALAVLRAPREAITPEALEYLGASLSSDIVSLAMDIDPEVAGIEAADPEAEFKARFPEGAIRA